MKFKTVGGHTFCPELIGDGCIIDVGCRGFEFARHFNNRTYCIDPDLRVFVDQSPRPNESFLSVAISDKNGESGIYINGEGTCLKEIDPDPNHPFEKCSTITMNELYDITGRDVEILKLDCEGAEYIILGEGFEPIPKQITVEFHHHCVPDLHLKHYQSIVERLSEHYTRHNDAWEQRHGCGFNFWDTLFIRK